MIWSIALAGLRDHPLLGWGPDKKADAIYAGKPEHFRFRGVMPALAFMLYRFQFANLLAKTDRLQASSDQLAQAVAADPEMGESLWRLGVFRWQREGQAQIGAKMIVQAADGTCRHPLSSSGEASLLARAFLVQGDLAGLRSMEQRLSEVPPDPPPQTSDYLEIARLDEQSGLLAERDRMLRIAALRDATVGLRLAPLFDGRVGTIAEAEGLAPLAAKTP